MILIVGFKYGTKYINSRDILVILFMTGYWETYINK